MLEVGQYTSQLRYISSGKIVVSLPTSLDMIEWNSNGTFTQQTLLTKSSFSLEFVFTKDEALAMVGVGSNIEIFKKEPTGYVLDQTLDNSETVYAMKLSTD